MRSLRGLTLRQRWPRAVEFVRAFASSRKLIAAICHGSWTLIDAGLVRGHQLTSWPSLRADLENAGAAWVDRAVVVDDGLVTSRKPADLPAFNQRSRRSSRRRAKRRASASSPGPAERVRR